MLDFDKLEKNILAFWKKEQIFEKTQRKKKGQKSLVFYEGPPTANGKPGIHHVLARAFKDLFPRYKTMQGFYCLRKGGWDTHGLPVELEVEKELGISGKKQIEEYGIAKFNQKCKESVFRYVDDWEKLTERIGFWIDMKNPYVTCHRNYIESCWWILKKLWNKGWLHKDYKVVPYCFRCGTPLSSHEVAQGYKDIIEDSIYVKFPLKDEFGTFLLVWTTTPWTLLGNVALAVDPKAAYVKVKLEKEYLILAEACLRVLTDKCQVIEKFPGEKLLGKSYQPLYDFVSYKEKVHYVVPADFVVFTEGTGIVHTAVMYGEEDFELGKKLGLPKHHVVAPDGTFTSECGQFAGKNVKAAEEEIIEDLKRRKLLLKTEPITHAYPFCWRCHGPLLYYAIDSWFIKTTAVKKALIRENNKTNWVPAYIKKGRMGNWLETLIDWSLSRNRYWGTPLPIWQCLGCSKQICIGSYAELEAYAGKVPKDPHRPYIDEVVLKCSDCGQKMTRVSEVIDCWFDSGAMPVAQWHYPFENEKTFKDQFPADFIAEAMDQTRGWFFTLLAISTLIFDRNSYQNVISSGLVLDEKGRKMSKHLGNIVDPWEIIKVTGADAIRWYFYSSTAVGNDYRFSLFLVQEVVKKFILTLWNVYNFFVTYVKVDGFRVKEQESRRVKENILDRWILSRLNQLIKTATQSLEKYDAFTASHAIEDFVSDLSTWYVRRSRDRIGLTAENGEDKNACYATLYEVLVILTKLLAPFTPFLAEEIYKNLTGEESVHLADWPIIDKQLIDEKLEQQMKMVRKICELGHARRKEAGIKVRQPLNRAKCKVQSAKLNDKLVQLIKDELNVKEIVWEKRDVKEPEVTLDTRLTPQLKAEGEARELVRQIQELRKKANCRLEQQIKVYGPKWPKEKNLRKYIKKETLTKELLPGKTLKIATLND